MKRLLAVLLSFALVALVGCASEPAPPMFVEAAYQNLPPPPADKAQIVFLEPINSIQGLLPVGLYDVHDSGRTLLAITGAHSKAAVLLSPGTHRLMASHSGLIAHFLEAKVEAGKRYYVLVRFIYGRGFQLRPLRTSGESDYSVHSRNFPEWMSGTTLVETTPAGAAHFGRMQNALDKTQAEAWASWLGKTDKEREELTLNPQDAAR